VGDPEWIQGRRTRRPEASAPDPVFQHHRRWCSAVPVVPAHAANSCTSYVHSFSFSSGQFHASGAAFCSYEVQYLHVYVRIFRTDVSPADSLKGNSRSCFATRICPEVSTDYVKVAVAPVKGCHSYEARTGGKWTPFGEPYPEVQFDVYDDQSGTISKCA
jgi:hypothetical protein